MRYIIVGNGAAGATAAEKIRALDPVGEIALFTDENYPYYYRPKLIYFLAGNVEVADFIMHDQAWFAERKIALHLAEAVTQIDPAAKTITTAKGTTYSYDKLLLANGSSPFVPPMPGGNHPQVFTLRTIADGQRILATARKSKSAVIIGGGLLGLEAGHSLLELGLTVTVLDRDPYLLPRQLDPVGGELLQNLLTGMGYQFLASANIQAIESGDTLTIRLEDGRTASGDFVLLSVGVRANLDLAKAAGLTCNRGIVVDDYLQTSEPDIFAAGDVCEHQGRGYGTWLPARQQGEVAGAIMTGADRQYTGSTPAHKLKVAGIDLVSLGQVTADGLTRLEQKRTDRVYRAFFHQAGIVKGAILIGEVADQTEIQRSIANGENIDNLLATLK